LVQQLFRDLFKADAFLRVTEPALHIGQFAVGIFIGLVLAVGAFPMSIAGAAAEQAVACCRTVSAFDVVDGARSRQRAPVG